MGSKSKHGNKIRRRERMRTVMLMGRQKQQIMIRSGNKNARPNQTNSTDKIMNDHSKTIPLLIQVTFQLSQHFVAHLRSKATLQSAHHKIPGLSKPTVFTSHRLQG